MYLLQNVISMKYYYLLFVLLLLVTCKLEEKQKSITSLKIDDIKIVVEEVSQKDSTNVLLEPCSSAYPIGGNERLKQIVLDNKNDIASDSTVIVFIHFVIDTLGNTKNHRILRGTPSVFSSEAIRIAKLFKFKPMICNEKPLKSSMVYKFEFN